MIEARYCVQCAEPLRNLQCRQCDITAYEIRGGNVLMTPSEAPKPYIGKDGLGNVENGEAPLFPAS